MAALSDLAETILGQITEIQYTQACRRWGPPRLEDADRPCRYVILGLGKLGGRELGYHSDLDLVLVYEGDGRTTPPAPNAAFDNFRFFTELAQRVIYTAARVGPMGRLYEIDMRLRPTGRSGSLVIPLAEFRRYYEEGRAAVWERQALTRARVVFGDPAFGHEVMSAIAQAAYEGGWEPAWMDEIRVMRDRLESGRPERDLKRGFGGVADVEFLVQALQLKYGNRLPEIRTPNIPAALRALAAAGTLSPAEHDVLAGGYGFLRTVESRLRLVHNRSVNELPDQPADLAKLARRLGFSSAPDASAVDGFHNALKVHTSRIREVFLGVLERNRAAEVTCGVPGASTSGGPPNG